ncbi:hypothetical protein JTB14_013621 [Gonioctena quinquepunctata]|nr:hypothetical protein JTB14_013621 [Gonioctena quinquepunctata]
MDSNILQQAKVKDEQNKNYKSREPSKHSTSSISSSSDESDAENDSVSTINSNTECVSKRIQDEESLFIHRYFSNHSNSLPSKITIGSRRLSQCREEDEEEEKKDVVPSNMSTIAGSDKSLSDSSNGSKVSVIDTISGPTHKFVITKTKIEETKNEPEKKLSEAAKIFANKKRYRQANTVHVSSYDPNRPSLNTIFKSPLQSPHYDSKFFDSSMIEIKSHSSSTSTVDHSGSVEDIWVKRNDSLSQGNKNSGVPLPISKDDSYIPPPESSSWTSKSEPQHNEKQRLKDTNQGNKWDSKRKKKKYLETAGSSTSGSNSPERRNSNDSDSSPGKHGFRNRSNSDASKRKGSTFMTSMKNAMVCSSQNDPDETESDNNDMEDNSHVSLDDVPETPIVIDRPYRTPSRSSASQPPSRTPSRTSTATATNRPGIKRSRESIIEKACGSLYSQNQDEFDAVGNNVACKLLE